MKEKLKATYIKDRNIRTMVGIQAYKPVMQTAFNSKYLTHVMATQLPNQLTSTQIMK
jgi:hypothetical protein